ncbi:hypothetical protein [Streptomyces fagopyri]|uniref:hypothetical protein n=1 Tax=Streptomyces fagopyri TaxID=2662397 RepID=UPI00382EC4C5
MSLAAMTSWRSVVADSGHPDNLGRALAEFQRRLPRRHPPLTGAALVGLGQECATVMRRIDRYAEVESVP